MSPPPPDRSSAQTRIAGRRPWWRAHPRLPYSPEPSGHLTRNLAYELAVTLVTATFAAMMLFGLLGGRFEDLYFRLRAEAPTTAAVAVVNIDEEALYLWNPEQRAPETTPRAMLAILIRFLHAAGADVIALDLLLDVPGPEDALLAAAARQHGAVLVAERFEPLTSGHAFVPATVGEIATVTHPAFANLIEEESALFSNDALVRRAPLVRRVSRAQLVGPWPGNLVGGVQDERALMPSLALAAAWLHVARRADPQATLSGLERRLTDGCVGPEPVCGVDWPALGLPDAGGPLHHAALINWRGPNGADGIPTVRAADVLRAMGATALMESMGQPMPVIVPDAVRAQVEGRIILIGRTTFGSDADRFVTPFAFPTYQAADMPGVRIHAQLVEQLLSGRHLHRVAQGWSWLLAVLLALSVARTRRWVIDGLHALGWTLFAVAAPAIGYALFWLTDGTVINPAPPMFGILGTLFLVHLRGWSIEDSLDSTELDELYGQAGRPQAP